MTEDFLPLELALFLLPFGRPRGLLGVGASLGSSGFFLGRPRPLFSAASFSPLEASGGLGLAPASLILPCGTHRLTVLTSTVWSPYTFSSRR